MSAARRARAGALVAALGLAALTAGCVGASTPAGPGATTSTAASPSGSSATSAADGPTSSTDATACATFGDRGVESRLVDVYADDAASAALVQEYAGAPAFQEALRQTVELLRSSGGELEGDFLATACADQPTG